MLFENENGNFKLSCMPKKLIPFCDVDCPRDGSRLTRCFFQMFCMRNSTFTAPLWSISQCYIHVPRTIQPAACISEFQGHLRCRFSTITYALCVWLKQESIRHIDTFKMPVKFSLGMYEITCNLAGRRCCLQANSGIEDSLVMLV